MLEKKQNSDKTQRKFIFVMLNAFSESCTIIYRSYNAALILDRQCNCDC